jgi:hypothetical protein
MSRVHDWDRLVAEQRPFRLAPPVEKGATLSLRQIWVGSLLVDIGPALLLAALTFLRGGNGLDGFVDPQTSIGHDALRP